MADIFEEVEEGLRQDKLTQVWKKYGVFAYLAAALLIGGVALYQYMGYRAEQNTTATTAELEAALTELDAQNYDAASAALQTLTDSDKKLAPVAANYLAGIRVDANGDPEAAAAILVEASARGDDATHRLSLMKAAYLRADTLTRAELETMLAPLDDDESAFGALATELIAAKALEEGDLEFARTEFNYLRLAANAPNGVIKRANQALASMPPVKLDIPDPEAAPPATETVPDTDTPVDAPVDTSGEETPE